MKVGLDLIGRHARTACRPGALGLFNRLDVLGAKRKHVSNGASVFVPSLDRVSRMNDYASLLRSKNDVWHDAMTSLAPN